MCDAEKRGIQINPQDASIPAVFIARSTEKEKMSSLNRVRTWYCEIVADVAGNMGQFACVEEDMGILERRVEEF